MNYFNMEDITDKKKFWKTLRPYFSDTLKCQINGGSLMYYTTNTWNFFACFSYFIT